MSIRPQSLKAKVLRKAKSLGITVTKQGAADKALTRGTKKVARVVNAAESKLKEVQTRASVALESVRSEIHKATAPKPPSPKSQTKSSSRK
jgi:hypothetical protein